ncbi:hypothetical protein [Sphingobium sp.]|uniref:hypothetical protein n=1 Tax=Sphingobium sp. TaxID=1912891 RepID=UPI0025802577|nr:hypothetical protein [Sphingobium sp.]MBR2268746.1 hypothetical protein [Sphingobium sp.]
MSEMIERVAKAIYEEDDPWHKAWPWPNLNESQGSPEPYRRIAAAAIKAMREPSEAMIEAGQQTDETITAVDVYRAMIDAALVGEG